MDVTPQDRGFYADSFYSSAWLYQGDDSSGAMAPSLSRTRAVSSQSTFHDHAESVGPSRPCPCPLPCP